MKKLLWIGIAVAVACLAATSSFAVTAFGEVDEASIVRTGTQVTDPVAFSTFRADLTKLTNELAVAPLARSNSTLPPVALELPMPDGTQQMFRVYDSPIMAPELAARYPELKTYEAYGVDDRSAFARFSVTPKGFHAIVFTRQGTYFVDPYQRNDTDHVISYYRSDYRQSVEVPEWNWTCDFEADPVRSDEIATLVAEAEQRGTTSTGDELRTYRLACAATGEYTIFHGGTKALGQAAIVVAINRVNGVYQRDVSLIMELVPNNDDIVYTNPSTDPYTNNNGGAMLSQNQSTCDAVIGSANYDIGHVFSTGGGGIAGLAVVCRAGQKARGVTGLPSPTGDGFYIDFVAHEIGHQYAANHTFNGSAGNCSGGNRSAGHAYEPGSGSTIMAYAGICGSHNIQFFSDDYFHNDSFNAIRAYTEGQIGGGCPVTTATGNTPPVVDADIGGDYTIPSNTPFEITGSATDADGDDMTYCWEQWDLGPAGHPDSPTGDAPLFRSFLPKEVPTRIFPKIEDILSDTHVKGEILPFYVRTMTFRLTVRDGLGGTNYATAQDIAVTLDGPFEVTNPNSSGQSFPGGSSQTVTWDVAGTDGGTINAANVDIFLSDDGGLTFPYTLVTGVPNDGSQSVIMPSIMTTTARVKVKASDNIFFDIGNFNFTITEDVSSVDPVVAGNTLLSNEPNPFTDVTKVSFRVEDDAPVSLRIYSPSGRVVSTLEDGVLPAGDYTRTWDGTDSAGRQMPSGVYFYRLEVLNTVVTKQLVFSN